MQKSQSLETGGFQAGEANRADDPFTGDKKLLDIARIIGAAAGYLRRKKVKGMIIDLEKHMMRTPESYVTAAASIGFVAGILLRVRR